MHHDLLECRETLLVRIFHPRFQSFMMLSSTENHRYLGAPNLSSRNPYSKGPCQLQACPILDMDGDFSEGRTWRKRKRTRVTPHLGSLSGLNCNLSILFVPRDASIQNMTVSRSKARDVCGVVISTTMCCTAINCVGLSAHVFAQKMQRVSKTIHNMQRNTTGQL